MYVFFTIAWCVMFVLHVVSGVFSLYTHNWFNAGMSGCWIFLCAAWAQSNYDAWQDSKKPRF